MARVPVFAVEAEHEEVPVDVRSDVGPCMDGRRHRKQQKRDKGGQEHVGNEWRKGEK